MYDHMKNGRSNKNYWLSEDTWHRSTKKRRHIPVHHTAETTTATVNSSSKKCLNVRQKLGTWKFFNVFLRFPMFSNVFQCYLISFSLSLSLFLTLTLFQSLIESLLTCWTTFVFILCSKLTLTLSLNLSLLLTLTLFQSLMHSLSTCWASFVFISMLKIRCL